MEHGSQKPNERFPILGTKGNPQEAESQRTLSQLLARKWNKWFLGLVESLIMICLISEFFEVSLFHKVRLMEFGSWKELGERVLGKAIPLCYYSLLEVGRDISKNLRLHIMFKRVQNLLLDFYFTVLRILIFRSLNHALQCLKLSENKLITLWLSLIFTHTWRVWNLN